MVWSVKRQPYCSLLYNMVFILRFLNMNAVNLMQLFFPVLVS